MCAPSTGRTGPSRPELATASAWLEEAAARWLSPPHRTALAAVIRLARESPEPVFLVGGAVRDLLLERPVPDLDLAIEGPVEPLARRLARALEARLELHSRFSTASLTGDAGPLLDLASCRRELYPEPAALPRVEPAPLAEDLARRDFALNAMAVRLGSPPHGQLVDPFHGRRDLEARQLRVLHDRSFLDDPTRILRGLQLIGRLDLRWHAATFRLAQRALREGALEPLSGDRLGAELRPLLALLLVSPRACDELRRLPILPAIYPELALDEAGLERLAAIARAREALGQAAGAALEAAPWELAWTALTRDLSRSARQQAGSRIGLTGRRLRRLTTAGEAARAALARARKPSPAPHELAACTRGMDDLELILLAADGGDRGFDLALLERQRFREFRLAIDGRRLVEQGYPPGPAIGRALAATRDARLDGRIGADEELSFATRRLGGKR